MTADLGRLSNPDHSDTPAVISVARCPEHGLHGLRTECFVCGGPVEQVAYVDAGRAGDIAAERDRLRADVVDAMVRLSEAGSRINNLRWAMHDVDAMLTAPARPRPKGRLKEALEDEAEEVKRAWRAERKVDGWPETAAEALQVAAVALRLIQGSERQP